MNGKMSFRKNMKKFVPEFPCLLGHTGKNVETHESK